jgi:C-terminal processing protease CtpA/Prc
VRYRRGVRAALLLAVGALSAACSAGGDVGSVGAVFGRDNETRALYVRDVPPGLGAEEAGLLPGDQVVMIDGLYVKDFGPKHIREKLRGPVGSTVALTILRGDEVRHVKVTRGALRAHEAPLPKETRIAE